MRVAYLSPKKIPQLECRKYPPNRNGVAASQMQATHTRLLSSMPSPTVVTSEPIDYTQPIPHLTKKVFPQQPLRGSSLLFVSAKSRQKPCDTLTLAKSLYLSISGTAVAISVTPQIVGFSVHVGFKTCSLPPSRKRTGGFCYVRYCRGAGRGLAVLTLGLVEMLKEKRPLQR